MNLLRRWLSQRLYMWSVRVHEDWHEVTVLDIDGAAVCRFGCYGDWVLTSDTGAIDFRCSCEETR